MANPNTYPSDGRLTSLQNFTGSFGGDTLLEIVTPGNATAGINYNVTASTLAQNLLPIVPAQNPNAVFAGPASGIAGAAPTFRALVPLDLPGLVRNAVASSYTVATTDMNKLIGLGGNPGTSLPFTLSLATASGYTASFVVTLYNESVSRGWAIAPNNMATFVLWPLQTVNIFNDNNTWKLSPAVQPWVVPAGTQFNVDNVNGSDSAANDGLSNAGGAGAFATVQHTFSVIQKQVSEVGAGVLIQLPSTTSTAITEQLAVAGAMPPGVGEITIVGNSGSATACQWTFTSNQGLSVTDYQSVTFNGIGFSATGTGNTFVSGSQFAILDFENCDFGTNSLGLAVAVSEQARGNILSGCSLSGNATTVGFGQATQGASLNIGSPIAVNTASLNIGNFAVVTQGGIITLSGLSFTGVGTSTLGGTKFISQRDGIISGDSGVSWPSNMTAGTTASGGISDAGLTNSALAAMNASTLKGNNTNTTGGPFDLTQAQAQGLLQLAQLVSSTVIVNLAAPGDTAIPVGLAVGFPQFRPLALSISQPTAAATAATFGLYTATSAGGTMISGTATVPVTVTTNTINTNNNFQFSTNFTNVNSEAYTPNAGNIYFHVVGTAAATVSLTLTYNMVA